MKDMYKNTNMKLLDYMTENYGWQSDLRLTGVMSEIVENNKHILDYQRHKDMIRNRALIHILRKELAK